MIITILDDAGVHHYFGGVSLEVGAAVMHALSGEPKPGHNAETGACMCSIADQPIPANSAFRGEFLCGACSHPAHGARAFCGALR